MTTKEQNQEILLNMYETLRKLKNTKPQEQGELTRKYAIVITEQEKLIGYFKTWICQE